MFYSPAFTFSSGYPLGVCRVPGFAFGRCASFKLFWPPALAGRAPLAIILQALRRFRGAVLFRSLRPSSSWGFPCWLLGLSVQSIRPVFVVWFTCVGESRHMPLYAGQHLFQRLAFLKGFSFGVLALVWASPAFASQVSSLFGL